MQKLEEVPNAVASIADKASDPSLPDSPAEVGILPKRLPLTAPYPDLVKSAPATSLTDLKHLVSGL